MPKPIKRINESGQPVTIVSQPQLQQPELTEEQILAACIKLGQSITEARDTTQLFVEEALDPSDVKLIFEARKEIEQEKHEVPQSMIPKRGAGIDARDAKRLKQRVTRRDPITHKIIAIEDV